MCSTCNMFNSKYAYAITKVYNNNQLIFSKSGYNVTYNESINISAGTVNIRVQLFGSGIEANLQPGYWIYTEGLPEENVSGFGLRVKSISNYDANNDLLLKKSYTYEDPFSTGKSSGYLSKNVEYNLLKTFKNYSMIYEGFECKQIKTNINTYSSSSITGFENSLVFYEWVSEKEIDAQGTSNGSITYQFNKSPDIVYDSENKITIDKSYVRNKPTVKIVMNNTNKEIQRTEYFYKEDTIIKSSREDFYVAQIGTSNAISTVSCLPEYSLDQSLSIFNVKSYLFWNYLEKEIQTNQYYNID